MIIEAFKLENIPLGYPLGINKSDIWKSKLKFSFDQESMCLNNESVIPVYELERLNFYPSSHMKSVNDHLTRWFSRIEKFINFQPNKRVLEIGCGDGVLMKNLKEKNIEVYGVDPSIHENMEYSGPVYKSFFDDSFVEKLILKNYRPNCIISSHVIYQIKRQDEFFKNIYRLLPKNGGFIFDSIYFPEVLSKNRIDGFSHLTCKWPTVNSINQLCLKNGLCLENIQFDKDYRGGSMMFFVRKKGASNQNKLVGQYIDWENKILTVDFFKSFSKRVDHLKNNALNTIHGLKDSKFLIFGFGGGLKASTILNWLGIDNSTIESCIDNDPHKYGLVVPGVNIPIVSLDDFKFKISNKQKIAVLNFALDHSEEVDAIIKKLNPNIKLINLLNL